MRTLTLLFVLLASGSAHAHGSAGDTSHWTFDPFIVVPLLVSGTFYVLGTSALWRRAGLGRGIRFWQAGAYACGWLTLAAALISPLHWLSEHLFTAHMIEHEIIMAVAAPLMAPTRPLAAMMWALPKTLRAEASAVVQAKPVALLWRTFTRPVNATLAHGAAIWIWHAPFLFDAAVENVALHRLQHLSFLLTGLLFWWSMLRRAEYGAAVGHLFVTMLHMSILGALIALAPRVLYQLQTADALAFGLTPLQDQQLAGLVMWVPAGTIYAGAALVFAALWISRSDRASTLREQTS
jgi:cytochrome c oxidase assembly factor CtaG